MTLHVQVSVLEYIFVDVCFCFYVYVSVYVSVCDLCRRFCFMFACMFMLMLMLLRVRLCLCLCRGICRCAYPCLVSCPPLFPCSCVWHVFVYAYVDVCARFCESMSVLLFCFTFVAACPSLRLRLNLCL